MPALQEAYRGGDLENPVLRQSYSSEAPHGRGIPAADDVTSQARG